MKDARQRTRPFLYRPARTALISLLLIIVALTVGVPMTKANSEVELDVIFVCGVGLDMTVDEVTKELGEPASVGRVKNGRLSMAFAATEDHGRTLVHFRDGRVTFVRGDSARILGEAVKSGDPLKSVTELIGFTSITKIEPTNEPTALSNTWFVRYPDLNLVVYVAHQDHMFSVSAFSLGSFLL